VTRTLVLELPLAELRAAAKAVVVSAGPAGYGGAGSPPVRRESPEGIVPPASRTASVNDAYLTALCGGLGRYHEALGVPVDALPLTLPVSLRGADDPASGNRIAGVTIAAPIGESDPAERMKQVREQVIARRGEPALDVIGRLAPVLSLLPDEALYDVVDRITPPDIQASNVPGYAQDTFLAGARVERQYGLGPLPRVAMMAILISRAGTCTVAFRYDTASFAAADLLEKCLQAGFDEIVELGRTPARSVSKSRPSRGGSSLPQGGPGGWVPPEEQEPAEPRRTS
jgi:hypothetical protein